MPLGRGEESKNDFFMCTYHKHKNDNNNGNCSRRKTNELNRRKFSYCSSIGTEYQAPTIEHLKDSLLVWLRKHKIVCSLQHIFRLIVNCYFYQIYSAHEVLCHNKYILKYPTFRAVEALFGVRASKRKIMEIKK